MSEPGPNDLQAVSIHRQRTVASSESHSQLNELQAVLIQRHRTVTSSASLSHLDSGAFVLSVDDGDIRASFTLEADELARFIANLSRLLTHHSGNNG